MIKVYLSSGEIEVLATSLLDEVKVLQEQFKALYHLRWGVEEDYKSQKISLEIKNFSGPNVHSVMQDLHAKVFTKNVILVASVLAQNKVDVQYSGRKHCYQVNKNQAISKNKALFSQAKK